MADEYSKTIVHHSHYCLDKQDPWIQDLAIHYKLPGPLFVGQGWTKRVGSDSYGGYVVSISCLKNGKPLVGLVNATTVMHGHWTEGTEDCMLPGDSDDPSTYEPTEYITTYGKYRDGKSKWYFCNKDGVRSQGQRCCYGFNGCSRYRDPSF